MYAGSDLMNDYRKKINIYYKFFRLVYYQWGKDLHAQRAGSRMVGQICQAG